MLESSPTHRRIVGLDGKEHLKFESNAPGFRPAVFPEGGTVVAALALLAFLSYRRLWRNVEH